MATYYGYSYWKARTGSLVIVNRVKNEKAILPLRGLSFDPPYTPKGFKTVPSNVIQVIKYLL